MTAGTITNLPLAKLSKAAALLAEVRSASEAKAVMAVASAAEHYAQRAKLSQEVIDQAHAIKIDAQRLLGEFLATEPKATGTAGKGRPPKLGGRIERPPKSERTLADIGVSKSLSSDSQALAAVAKADPDLFQKVRDGELSVRQAARAVINQEKRRELEAKAAAAPEPSDDAWRIIQGNCVSELRKLRAGSARLVFADPPYNIGRNYHGQGADADLRPDREYLDFCRRWMIESARVLTDDGSLWVMICSKYADHFGLMLRQAGLHRRAWIVWREGFGMNCTNNFNRCSRHIFYCVKNARHFVFNRHEVAIPSDRQIKYDDPRADPAGKLWDDVWEEARLVGNAAEKIPGFDNQLPLAILERIVACASYPGDLVVDPFNGTGTTGAACIALGRKFIGIEKNANACDVARQRLRVTIGESKRKVAA
jgi:DNA modification methylase